MSVCRLALFLDPDLFIDEAADILDALCDIEGVPIAIDNASGFVVSKDGLHFEIEYHDRRPYPVTKRILEKIEEQPHLHLDWDRLWSREDQANCWVVPQTVDMTRLKRM